MKIFSTIFWIIFILFFYVETALSSLSNKNPKELEKEIQTIERELNSLQENLKIIREKIFYVKKIIAFTIIKGEILKRNLSFFDKEKDYFNLRKKYLLYSNLYQALYNDLVKKEKEIQKLTLIYQKKIEENKRLKAKYYEELVKKETLIKTGVHSSPQKIPKIEIYDPITGKLAKEGSFKKRVPIGTPIFSPFRGKVKKIGFFEGTLSVAIENDKCYALLSGLSLIHVSPGEEIVARKIIGEVGFSEGDYNFYYEIFCSSK